MLALEIETLQLKEEVGGSISYEAFQYGLSGGKLPLQGISSDAGRSPLEISRLKGLAEFQWCA